MLLKWKSIDKCLWMSAEIVNAGWDILKGKAKVMNDEGQEVMILYR